MSKKRKNKGDNKKSTPKRGKMKINIPFEEAMKVITSPNKYNGSN